MTKICSCAVIRVTLYKNITTSQAILAYYIMVTLMKQSTFAIAALLFLSLLTVCVTSNSAIGSEVAKRLFVSAIVTVAYEACCGHILEFIKSTFVLLSVAANNGFPMNMMMMQ
mmetsp:Transcript_25038/g.52049  ORF Transcript_25038/g.52049 Transcript_25038/m.52049 type:complete len:113 (-) Transcript_25038:826-1164(-)